MGLFSGKRTSVAFIETALDEQWFLEWADSTWSRMEARGRIAEHSELSQLVPSRGVLWFLDKATAVIDRDARDYVTRYCDRAALGAYDRYMATPNPVPWRLVSLVAGCKPTDNAWREFIVDDAKAKLGRFGDILVDPSIIS